MPIPLSTFAKAPGRQPPVRILEPAADKVDEVDFAATVLDMRTMKCPLEKRRNAMPTRWAAARSPDRGHCRD